MDGPEQIAPERSAVVLPAALQKERLVVRREVKDTVLHERVVLANDTASPGENTLSVMTRYRGMPYYRFFSGPLRNPFTEGAVRQRIQEEFAGQPQVSQPLDRVNRFGPYRYVVARGREQSCVLAWQLIDSPAAITGRVNTYAVDFRFCDRERAAEELMALYDQIELRPYL